MKIVKLRHRRRALDKRAQAVKRVLDEVEEVLRLERMDDDEQVLALLGRARRALEAAHWRLMRLAQDERRGD